MLNLERTNVHRVVGPHRTGSSRVHDGIPVRDIVVLLLCGAVAVVAWQWPDSAAPLGLAIAAYAVFNVLIKPDHLLIQQEIEE